VVRKPSASRPARRRAARPAAVCGPDSPRPLLDKLGIKPGSRVSVLGLEDPAFRADLATRTSEVSSGRARKGSDTIFAAIRDRSALARLSTLMKSIHPDGQIWVLWPKGRKELTENHVRDAALPLGLVDTKVVSFSSELSGLRLVIRKELRGAGRP
jgi:hypothetical protein